MMVSGCELYVTVYIDWSRCRRYTPGHLTRYISRMSLFATQPVSKPAVLYQFSEKKLSFLSSSTKLQQRLLIYIACIRPFSDPSIPSAKTLRKSLSLRIIKYPANKSNNGHLRQHPLREAPPPGHEESHSQPSPLRASSQDHARTQIPPKDHPQAAWLEED